MTNRQTFEAYVAARGPSLLSTSYLLTRDWARAEDLLQTALARAWLAWTRIDGSPEPYVRKILVNTFASSRRRRWKREEPYGEVPDTQAASDQHDQLLDREALWRALGQLPKRQRAVLILRYFEDLSEAEVADVLGCSVGTVKSQTHRALAKLRIDPSLAMSEGVLP